MSLRNTGREAAAAAAGGNGAEALLVLTAQRAPPPFTPGAGPLQSGKRLKTRRRRKRSAMCELLNCT